MQAITKVATTGLYWDTLAPLRTHARYQSFRAQIDDMIVQRASGGSRMSLRDKIFSVGALSGVWHWAFSRNPDLVLFYTVSGDTLTMCMVGDHGDYSFAGNGIKAAGRTARRVWNAVDEGHVARPGWRTLPWKRPSDILANPYLHEHSAEALGAVHMELMEEADSAPRYERLHGRPLLEAGEDELTRWIDEVMEAQAAVAMAMAAAPVTPERVVSMAMEREASRPAP